HCVLFVSTTCVHFIHSISFSFLFFFIIQRPPISTLFPYTTLFRSDRVRTDLETVTSGHQQMIDELFDSSLYLEDKVFDFDTFLGDVSDITLDERLQDINRNFEERIRNVDGNTYNMLRGTRFDESGMWDNQSTVVLMDD